MPKLRSSDLRGALRLVATITNGRNVAWASLRSRVHFDTLQRLVVAGVLTSPQLDAAGRRLHPELLNPRFSLTWFGWQVLADLERCADARPAR